LNINEQIIKEIEKGFVIEENFFEFALNSGFEIDFYDIKEIMAGSDESFLDDLVYFIFTPDFEMRKRFSLIWLEMNCDNKKIDLDFISEKIKHFKIIYKNLSDFVNSDKKVLCYFLEKLDFSKKTDDRILQTLNNFEYKEKQFLSSLVWKNALTAEGEKADILNEYLEKSAKPFLLCEKEFEFFLNLLGGWKTDDYDFVVFLKKMFYIYHKAYRQSLETKDFLKNNNVETFMIQGGRVAFSNPDEISEKKNLVWQIALRLGIHNQICLEDSFETRFKINNKND
jgi:hypothetical protein